MKYKGFFYFAGSNFIKYLKYYVGAIIAGYLGNLQLMKNTPEYPFVGGNSPTSILQHKTLINLGSKSYNKLFNDYQIELSLSYVHTFHTKKATNLPLEFDTTPVDEHIGIYDYMNKNNYQEFIDKANGLFNKYKTNCNPKNKKFLLITKKSDGKLNNKVTHGGYECGNDGKWSSKCIPSYCDMGYLFHTDQKKCIKDICEKISIAGNRGLI